MSELRNSATSACARRPRSALPSAPPGARWLGASVKRCARGPSEGPLTRVLRTDRGPISPRRIFILTCGFADSEALRRGSREGEGLSGRGAVGCLRIVVHERSRGEAVRSADVNQKGRHP